MGSKEARPASERAAGPKESDEETLEGLATWARGVDDSSVVDGDAMDALADIAEIIESLPGLGDLLHSAVFHDRAKEIRDLDLVGGEGSATRWAMLYVYDVVRDARKAVRHYRERRAAKADEPVASVPKRKERRRNRKRKGKRRQRRSGRTIL